ncbi:MAG: hypothetical protein JWO83_4973 [Caulobacteraceae bacterium]|nr:hypothetical protein [Caulobacteraceae bacterium]
MRHHLFLTACCVAVLAGPVLAQTTEHQTTVVEKKPGGTTAGAVAGAATGAVVAGPVGAVVGGVVGATVGHTVAPPREVRTYITSQDVPPITYGHAVVVGETVDGDVVWRDAPDYPRYQWAYLDGRRVVVDAKTHRVLEVY